MSDNWTLRNILYGLFVFLCASALVWPGFAWFGNRIEPYVLGLPFGMTWNVGWIIASFSALLIYHLTGPEED